jgi:hypothetical protein
MKRAFGPFSIVSAILGLGLQQSSNFFANPKVHDPLLLTAIIVWLIGMGCGITGMVRPEALRWLPAVGFGFNLVLIAVGFMT